MRAAGGEGVHGPRPVSKLAALEASSGVAGVLGRLTAAVRDLNANFVAHKEAFVVLGDALLGGLFGIEFLNVDEETV
jgi:hypothetical protein